MQVFVDFDLADHLINFAAPKTKVPYMLCVCFVYCDSHGNSPKVSGPLSDKFSASALKAMSAEEAQDAAGQTAANVAETSTAAAATATVEATSADADLGSVGLPAQHIAAQLEVIAWG